MRKIKIFSDCGYMLVEKQVNEWLADHKSAIIHRVLQTESFDNSWSLTITIFYYEGEGS